MRLNICILRVQIPYNLLQRISHYQVVLSSATSLSFSQVITSSELILHQLHHIVTQDIEQRYAIMRASDMLLSLTII